MKIVTTITSEVEEPKKVTVFDSLRIGLTDTGVTLYARAPLWLQWLKLQPDAIPSYGTSPVWLGGPQDEETFLYRTPRTLVEATGDIPTDRLMFDPGHEYLMDSGIYNAPWLFHSKLDRGISLEIPHPFPPSDLEDYFDTVLEYVADVYALRMRKVVLEGSIVEILP